MASKSILVVLLAVASASAALTSLSKTARDTEAYYAHLGAKKMRTTYGPFSAPMNMSSMGMIDYTIVDPAKPCEDCLIIWTQAGLIYGNGTTANANTSMWLHHTAWVNLNRRDFVCPTTEYERWFASGNERGIQDLTDGGTVKAGYPVNTGDRFAFLIELMNMAMEDQNVTLTMDWQYIPRSNLTANFNATQPMWLDISGCTGDFEVNVPDTQTAFSFSSPAFTNTMTGEAIRAGGHLHDGGVDLQILKNGVLECDAIATYGGGGYDDPTPPMTRRDDGEADDGGVDAGMETDDSHLSHMSGCASSLGTTAVGDVWTITANYNSSMHPLMLDANGMPMPVMGIAMVFLSVPQNVTT